MLTPWELGFDHSLDQLDRDAAALVSRKIRDFDLQSIYGTHIFPLMFAMYHGSVGFAIYSIMLYNSSWRFIVPMFFC